MIGAWSSLPVAAWCASIRRTPARPSASGKTVGDGRRLCEPLVVEPAYERLSEISVLHRLPSQWRAGGASGRGAGPMLARCRQHRSGDAGQPLAQATRPGER
jgi:hypothetical protein